jgi:tol-pal system protein YbgF
MPRVRPAALVTAMLTLLAAACASTPEEDPVQQKLTDLDARETRVERESQSMVAMSQQVEELQAQVRQLRGRVDDLEHQNAEMSKEQHDLYNDLSKRIAGGQAGTSDTGGAGSAGAASGAAGDSGGAAAAAGGAAGAAGSNQPASVEQSGYNQSFDALKAGSYSVAITSFKDFLTNYPQSSLAPGAQYWLGEAYYVNRDYESAANAFRSVVKKWPDSPKAASALLKLGFTQYQQKQYAAARATLTQLTQKYPGSDSARQAADRLQRIPAQ